MDYTLSELMEKSVAELANELYNRYVMSVDDTDTAAKMTPYIGWYWRHTDFVGKDITIGKTDDGFVGVMESNKWGYPQRQMTTKEADTFIELLDEAIKADDETRKTILLKLWDWFQILEVE